MKHLIVMMLAVFLSACASNQVMEKPQPESQEAAKALRAAAAEAAEQVDRERFLELKEKFFAGDTDIDFSELRETYTAMKDYSPYGGPVRDALNAARDAYKADKPAECLEIIDTVYERAFPLLVTNFFGRRCAEELKQQDRADEFLDVGRAIYQAITIQGEGKTPQTAFKTISVSELYLVLYLENLKSQGQAMAQNEYGIFDEMTVRPILDDGSLGPEEKRYFDIARQMTRGMRHGK